MVHPGGAPRTVSPPPNEMIALGEEMIAWVIANKPNHISAWYSGHKRYTYKEWQVKIKLPEFVGYYEQALSLIAQNYLDGTVPPAIANRFIRLYFKDTKNQEDADKQADLDRELEQKKKIIDHQSTKDLGNLISPIQDDIDKDHLIMRLQHKLAEFEANAHKS